MKQKIRSLLIAVAGASLLAGGWWFYRGSQQTAQDASTTGNAEPSEGAVAPVKIAPINKGTIVKEITVYGTIVPAAGAVQTITVPFESRVRRIVVTEGQQVSRGDPLLDIEPSPETNLQVEQARNEYETAQKAFQYMQQRFDLKLATNDQLLQTKQALEQAQTKLESMRRRGSASPRTIHAEVASLITKVGVQEGAIVPAGNTMIEMVAENRLEARMGVEPEDSDKVKPGQEVSLARVNASGAETIIGQIRKVSRSADAATRLVQVFTALPSTSRFLLGEYVLGKIPITSANGLIVPRSAVLPQEDHYVVFTVKNGSAKQHTVRLGPQNERDVAVIAADLQPGDLVVILGNYELKDGMAVKVDESR